MNGSASLSVQWSCCLSALHGELPRWLGRWNLHPVPRRHNCLQYHLRRPPTTITEFLRRLRERGVKLKPSKCKLFQRGVVFLGRVLSEDRATIWTHQALNQCFDFSKLAKPIKLPEYKWIRTNERHVHLSTINQNNYAQPPSTNICPFQHPNF